MMIINREELAWAAGFFDGEGTTTLTPFGAYTDKRIARLSINQNDPEVLEHFHNATGKIGVVRGPYLTRMNPYWTYAATGPARVQQLVAMMWPWLGTMKKDQARRTLLGTHWPKPRKNGDLCRKGHSQAEFRNKWGQCLACNRLTDKARRG